MPTDENKNTGSHSESAVQHSHSDHDTPTTQMSPDTRRTLTFAAIAVACLAITGIIEWASRPAPIKEFGKVGEEFYKDFVDPTRATALEVYAFDKEKAQPLEFAVRRTDQGRWVIPSHHDYPADAKDRLAKTAASIIGILRGALVTRWPSDHAQYGVVDPKQDSLSVGDVEGIGKRIILRGEDNSTLADYIIGEKAEGGERDQYYVRKPDEDDVYIADLNIDLSTKFTDWIDSDLLEMESWDLRELTLNDTSFDELQGRITERQVNTLQRTTSSDSWNFEGLNEETEEVNADAVRDTANTLADLKIIGVRPKQKGLTPDLKLDRAALKSQADLERLQSDLLKQGFLLLPGENNDQENLRLVAREGELYAATEKGLYYRVYFGRAFTGSQEELEIGLTASDEGSAEPAAAETEEGKKADAAGEKKTADEAASDTTDANSEEAAATEEAKPEDSSSKPGRYVFVRVEFDQKYLGEEPVKPVEPEKPAELQADEAKPDDAAADTAKEQPKTESEDGSAEEKEEDPLAELRATYEADKAKYEEDLQEYERKKQEYEQKLEDGKKKAEELNRRFANWYYVIPGDSFDQLKLARADLVKPKEQKTEEGAEGAAAPAIDTPAMPDSATAGDAPAPAVTETPAAPTTETPEPPADAPAAQEPPTADDTPEPPPASETPASSDAPATPDQPASVPEPAPPANAGEPQ